MQRQHFQRCLLAIVTMIVISGCATTERQALHLQKEALLPDSPIAAAAFRYQQRLSEDGTIPPNALMRAKAQRDAMINAIGLGSGVNSESWEWIGPGNIGGRIRPVVFHPDDPDIIWIGSASGGIWKTTNSGAHWEPLDDFMPSLAVSSLVMDPTDPDILYAGTGEGFFETVEGSSNTAAVRGAGIFITEDGGTTWEQLPSTANPDFSFVNRLIIDPKNGSYLVAATRTGIHVSDDAGASWTRAAKFAALQVVADPTDFNNLVAGGHHAEDGPYYSIDAGQTWQQAQGAGGHRQELAYAPSDPSIVYALVAGDNNRFRAWRSLDAGQTYTLMTDGGGPQTWASYNLTIWVDPDDPDHLIAGGVFLNRSTDAGKDFDGVFGNVHADMHNIIQHPEYDGVENRIVYFATDGGLYRTDNVFGGNAFDLNNNLGITQFYGAGINPTTGHVIGGTQDNGTLFYSGNKQSWNHIFGGDGGYGEADPTDPDYFYGEVQRALLHRSTNGGQSSGYIFGGPNPIEDAGSLDVNFIPFFTLDPNEPNTMFVAAKRLWRSRNVKANQPDWFVAKESIEPPAPDGPRRADDAHFAENDPFNMSTIAVAEGESDLIWVGYNNGQVWFTANGTEDDPDWVRVDDNAPLPDRWVSWIRINPADHNEVYLAFMGWEQGNIWKTENAGQTWQQISGAGDTAIPAAPASALAIHPTKPGLIYVGTDIGVFTSDDDGQTWTTSTEGPGTVPVEGLRWKGSSGDILMAVTHGRGIFLAEVGIAASLEDFTIVRGMLLEGDVEDLGESDDVYARINSVPGFTAAEANVTEVSVGTVTQITDAKWIDLEIESAVDHPNGTATVSLRDWNAGVDVEVAEYDIDNSEHVFEVDSIDALDFVQQSDGRIEATIRHVVPAIFVASGFISRYDEFVSKVF